MVGSVVLIKATLLIVLLFTTLKLKVDPPVLLCAAGRDSGQLMTALGRRDRV